MSIAITRSQTECEGSGRLWFAELNNSSGATAGASVILPPGLRSRLIIDRIRAWNVGSGVVTFSAHQAQDDGAEPLPADMDVIMVGTIPVDGAIFDFAPFRALRLKPNRPFQIRIPDGTIIYVAIEGRIA